MEPEILHDQLLQLLKQTFGTKVEMVDQQVTNQDHDYLVFIVRLRYPSITVVVKLAGPDASMASSFERTAMLHRLVHSNTDIPMPEIFAISMSYSAWPWRYLIKAYIPGQEWAVVRRQMNPEGLSSGYQQIGSAIAQLHMIKFPEFGELGLDGSVQGDKSYLPAFIKHAGCSIKSAHLRSLFFSLLDEHKILFTDVYKASLCHEDLHGHNILFQYRQGEWHLASILDFDKAWAGHYEIDLARLEFWKGMISEEFWKAYKATTPIEPLYEQRRPIYQLLWCFEYARTTPEHLADTQRLCAKLGLPQLENFD
jgi:fructosamine-3-kinase